LIILKDIIQNYLMGNKFIADVARKFHNTGVNSDSEKLKTLLNYYSAKISFKNKKILEIGPGQTFDILFKALEDGAEYCAALDIANYPNKQFSEIDFKIYDGKKFPFNDKTFDLIISNDAFEHLRFPEITVEECGRVLISGGIMIVQIDLSDHYNLNDDSKIFECLKYGENLWRKMTSNRSSFVNRLRYSGWKNIFESTKFKIISEEIVENDYIKKNYLSIDYLKKLNEKDASVQRINYVLKKEIL